MPPAWRGRNGKKGGTPPLLLPGDDPHLSAAILTADFGVASGKDTVLLQPQRRDPSCPSLPGRGQQQMPGDGVKAGQACTDTSPGHSSSRRQSAADGLPELAILALL